MTENQTKNRGGQMQDAVPFPEEIARLAETHRKLDEALKEANSAVEQIDREYLAAKRYMAEYRGEIDPNEMFQTELLLKQTDQTGAFAVSFRDQIARLKDSPYFARIDFRGADGREPEKYYIGKFSFSYQDELLIFDWRAPVASMFYDYELGPAGFDAPAGRVNGELTKKRQFQIKNGVMEYAIESSSNVQDDILRRELSSTSDEKMKSIISTIQREQNQIIRNESADTLVIQGVAGSGKTSIALHRVAYLLYRFQSQLSAQNVTILSPNKVFGDYISNVIPELGEEPVLQLRLEDLAQAQLGGGIRFETAKDPLETEDEKWMRRVRFKSSVEFMERLDGYRKELPDLVFAPEDDTFGRFTAKREWILERFRAYRRPVKQRLSMVAEDIHDRFQTDNIMEDEVPRVRTILKSLTAMLTVKSALPLYREFYRRIGAPEQFVMPEKNTLEWEDVFPFLYLASAFDGLKQSKLTKHLVIDEMQDYTPIQYAALNLMFPCPKTILGDFGQAINPNHTHTLDGLKQLYREAEFVSLNKSYRSTYEIITFAKRIQKESSLEAVERHGDAPAVIACGDKEDQLRRIKEMISAFLAGRNASLGIILKTNAAAKELYSRLPEEYGAVLLSPQSAKFQNGVSVMSIQMSKGLEFDEVIIPDADSGAFGTEYDRNLLYIACTRAMHRLTLLYTGKPSLFLPQPGK